MGCGGGCAADAEVGGFDFPAEGEEGEEEDETAVG